MFVNKLENFLFPSISLHQSKSLRKQFIQYSQTSLPRPTVKISQIFGVTFGTGSQNRCFPPVLTVAYSAAPAASGGSADQIFDIGITIFLLGWKRSGIHLLNDNYDKYVITRSGTHRSQL